MLEGLAGDRRRAAVRPERRPGSRGTRRQTTDRSSGDSHTVDTCFGFLNSELDPDLVLFVGSIFDEQRDVFIGVGNGEPTFKYTNRPLTIGIEFTKGFGH